MKGKNFYIITYFAVKYVFKKIMEFVEECVFHALVVKQCGHLGPNFKESALTEAGNSAL